MNTQWKISLYKWTCYVCTFCFALFALYWIYDFHKYQLIAFQEETQLFRTDQSYLFHYLSIPGGISRYIGNFITQYYQNLFVGSVILTLLLLLMFIIIMKYSKRLGNVYAVFIYPFIAYILLLFWVTDPDVRLGEVLGICFTLLSFWCYTTLSGKHSWLLGMVLSFVVYFIAGGHFLLFLMLLLIHAFANKPKASHILCTLLCAFAVPYLAYLFIYTVTLKEAFFALTPFESSRDNTIYKILWFYIPLCFLICSLSTRKKKNNQKIVFWNAVYVLAIIGITFGCMYKKANPAIEHIAAMTYHVEKGNWENVLTLSRKEENKENALKYYYTNIALSEQGLLLEQLLKYPQIGQAGLFVKRTLAADLLYAQGELYYRLGYLSAAEQGTYEALVSNRYEYGSKALKRLVEINLLQQNKQEFRKYIGLFKNSPIYTNWAVEQENRFNEMPPYKKQTERFMNYGKHETNLTALLKNCPSDKKTFEYLIASLLLQKELRTFLVAMDRYAKDMNYDVYPRYIQEALVLCFHNIEGHDDLLEKYTIDETTNNLYRFYATELQDMNKSAAYKENFKNNFEDTYWYYYQYGKSIPLEETKAKGIY
ncbi:DUF6057 family protein [Bacteroides sp. 519]|uniref:DUF6057 family protein n=1 Tax=Bacteroides sp. 519 TaxID=2302937 RepID=UPI0013D50E7A|nr:DUF6057 family protein [Bacteroides sp. 519]NDV60172.1 hypothetical protein [Bacteroides sp. 519]